MSNQVTIKTAGSTSQVIDVGPLLQNAASTAAGDPILALAYNTTNLTAYYRIAPTGSVTAITLATQTVGGAYSSGGFVKLDDTHMPGMYRFDVPAACLASAGEVNIEFAGAAAGTAGTLEAHTLKIIVTAMDFYDAVRAGLTSLRNIASVTGTAQAGAAGTITLANGTTNLQAAPGDVIILLSGTGAGQAGKVSSLSGSGGASPIATMHDNWPIIAPDSTSVYQILTVDGVQVAGPSDLWTYATRVLTSATNLTSDNSAVAKQSSISAMVGSRLDCNIGSVAGVAVQQNGSGTQNIGGP